MAHFYANIRGSARKGVTRCGTKNSGISGHIRGWNLGVRVVGSTKTDSDGDYDTFTVWLTSGSNGCQNDMCLGTFIEDDLRE